MSSPENLMVAAEKTKGALFKERIVDIYVSAESLFVYDKPWMEGDSTGAAVDNVYAEVASQQKKACRTRAVLPWLLVFPVLVVITRLGVALKEEKSTKSQPNVNQTSTLREVQEKVCEQIGCTDNWKRLHCSCYFIFTQNKDDRKKWKDSQEHCWEENAHLVTVTTTEEQEFVSKLTLDNTAWVGLKYVKDEVCRWVDGTRLPNDSFWSDRQQDDSWPVCAFVEKTGPTARWKRSRCYRKRNWICEKRIE